MIGTTSSSSRVSYQLRYISSMGASGPLLHINENSEWENLNHFFCRNASLLTGHRCQFRGVSQDMKQT
jgi:hypothetical protein